MTFQPELLTEVPNTADSIQQFLLDPDFAFQEKFNGRRRIVIKDGTGIYSLNKTGERRDLPRRTIMGIRDIPFNFIIDTELMLGDTLRVFDAMIIGDRNLLNPNDPEPYEARIEAARVAFDSHQWIVPVDTAYTAGEKLALVGRLIGERAEGLVIRRLHAPYKQGESRQHFKVKFTKTLDAVVIGPSPKGHQSVEIGLYDEAGKLRRIAGVSLIGRPNVNSGDVVEVTYLYATRDHHIVQPRMSVVRDDKAPRACKMDQLIYNRDMEPVASI